VYRGTAYVLENWIAETTGYLMSDVARTAYVESGGSIEAARLASQEAHAAAVEAWGSEADYAQAHGEWGGGDLSDVGPRTMISFTTDPDTARGFAGPDGVVWSTVLEPGQGIWQSLPGAGESEVLVPNMIEAVPFVDEAP
jgi:hypothetical protein